MQSTPALGAIQVAPGHPMGPLIATPQWILVKLVPLATGKTDKIPCHFITGEAWSAHDPAVWTTYDAAVQLAASRGQGWTVGFVITAADPWFCLDIDNALQPTGWSPLAQTLAAALPGTMVEISQSGKGLHVWGRHPTPPSHRCKRIDLGIELYSSGRFIAIGTGQVGEIAPVCDALPAFIAEWFPPKEIGPGNSHGEVPRAEWRGPTDDDELLRRALRSQSAGSAFGGKASFADLWDRNVPVLAQCYRGDNADGVDWSSVDSALAQHLAFWTGCDAERMERLMRRSALVREKWDFRSDYLRGAEWSCIDAACRMQRDVLQDRVPTPLQADPSTPVPTMARRDGATYVPPEQAAELFRGCVYVRDLHRVLVPGGKLLKPDQFNATFGGYVFVMDDRNERTSRKAFEAFTENQVFRPPMADGTCFRPLLAPGTIVETEGRRRVNMWAPPKVRSEPGDVSPFLQHLSRLLPDSHDRDTALYYLANLVQHAGHKFQWALVLQGTEGNGKSFLSRCVAAALGKDYVAWPAAGKLGEKFNAWLFGKLAYLVEDFKVEGDGRLLEQLKPMITGDALEIEAKGVDQRTDEVCGNWLFNANARDAMPITRDTRRYGVLWCAQQNAEDLARDGMGPDYFEALYRWARADGYAHVAHYLQTLPLPAEFGLSWATGRAPQTSSTADAIEATRSPAEQAVLDAIEEGRPGFRGGWVSSIMLRRLLESSRRDTWVKPAARAALMSRLGYVRHPALGHNGQVHNDVLPDAGKPQLFVLPGVVDPTQTKPADVAAAYARAQGAPSSAPMPIA